MALVFGYVPVGAFVGMVIMIVLYVAIMLTLVIYTLLHLRIFGRSSLLPDGFGRDTIDSFGALLPSHLASDEVSSQL